MLSCVHPVNVGAGSMDVALVLLLVLLVPFAEVTFKKAVGIGKDVFASLV